MNLYMAIRSMLIRKMRGGTIGSAEATRVFPKIRLFISS